MDPNVILSQDSQVGNPEFFEMGTLVTLEAHNFSCGPPIEVDLKKSYSPGQDLSNNISHATYKQVN
jgi:hypothetical protein